MSDFIKQGNDWMVSPRHALDVHDKLPPGTYTTSFHPDKGFFLSEVENFVLPAKMYGSTASDAERILTTFAARKLSTGVLLCGEKGSGKTLLAKTVASMGKDIGLPTILNNSPFRGDGFNRFIQSIDQPAIVIFDEFEKIYHEDGAQDAVLTLFDGVFPQKKLFIVTCNDKYKIDKHMHNRPGRMFYQMEFFGIGEDFIRQYCEDRLENKSHINSIVEHADMYDPFNFYMLQAMVEEMNRYHETPEQTLRFLNITQAGGTNASWKINLTVNGKKPSSITPSHIWCGNPTTGDEDGEICFSYWVTEDKDNGGKGSWHVIDFTPKDITDIDVKTKTYTFVAKNDSFEEKVVLKLTKKAKSRMSDF